MFESLRKKFEGFFNKPEEDKKPTSASKKKTPKKPSKKREKSIKTNNKKTKETEKLPEEIKEKIEELDEIEKELEELSEHAKKTPEKDKLKEKDSESLPEEKNEENLKEEKQGFFSKLAKRISSSELTQDQFEEFYDELELTLLENNVALEVSDKIKESLSNDLIGKKFSNKEAEKNILEALKKAILSILIEPPDLIEKIKNKKEDPFVMVFFGINGSGKTTSIAKLAHKLKENGISCILGAGDTFRAASIEQLEKHGENIGIKVVKQEYGSDPAAVAFDTISHAKKNKIQAVLIDTAGRMYTKSDLLREMQKIIRVSQPDLKIFVGESITGNDATEQAKKFNEAIGIDGIILSKADVDEKAGTILSVSYVIQKPIYYLGTGQKYSDLTKFTNEKILKNLGLE